MTHRLRRLPALLLAGGLGLGLTLAVPAAASAGTDPGIPSQTQIRDHHGLQPEFFTLKVVNDNPGRVVAFGPVHGFATDTEDQSGFSGVFDFGDGNTVTVLHTNVDNVQPQINYRDCTATAFAVGHWLFDGGTGKYERAFGFGHFKFFLFLVLQRDKWGHCDTNPKDQPKFTLVKVIASGLATAGHGHDHGHGH